MSVHGGYRANSGRPKGSRNKRTIATLDGLVSEMNITPLDFLTSVYMDENQDPKIRVDAAKAAAPYVHAKLSCVELNSHVSVTSHEEWLNHLS